MLFAIAIVSLWGIPALVRTKGEFFWVGIGRHVVERSFGPMEGHGGQTLSSYLLTLPFYFVTVFVSFFPWSIKLPALTKRLWRERDAVDKYLISGTAIVFLLMTVVKTKLPHYTLIAFPLLSLLLARHLFELPVFCQMLRRLPVAPGSFAIADVASISVRTAVIAFVCSLAVSLFGFPIVAPTIPTVQLFKKVGKGSPCRKCILAHVDYAEPSVVWYFRSRVRQFLVPGITVDRVEKFMTHPGPRFLILPTELAKTFTRSFRQAGNRTPPGL